jgi:hypothetical protein
LCKFGGIVLTVFKILIHFICLISYLTVDEFYKRYPNMQFYKLLNADEKHYGVHFTTGLNVDILEEESKLVTYTKVINMIMFNLIKM